MKRDFLEVKGKSSCKIGGKSVLKLSLNRHVLNRQDSFLDIISGFCSLIKTKTTLQEIYKCFNFYANKIGFEYIGICLKDEYNNSLNLRTFQNGEELECFELSLLDSNNYLIQTFLDKSKKFANYSELSAINCPNVNEYLVIPIIFQGDCLGLVIAGSLSRNKNRDELLNTLCNYLGLLICNNNLKERLDSYNNEDENLEKPASDGSLYEYEIVKKLQSQNKYSEITLEVVTSLAAAIDAKDTYTRGHSQSVSQFAEALAKAINLDEIAVERIKLAAILHDIGKIGISETILRKAGPLTDHEWEVMKQHPIIGVKKILEPVKSLNDLIPIVRHHHERIDGTGYPDRLKGDEIPLGAKIVAISDAFHAMISNRPYRKALGVEKAIEILKSGKGTQWDTELVDKFISIAPDLCKD